MIAGPASDHHHPLPRPDSSIHFSCCIFFLLKKKFFWLKSYPLHSTSLTKSYNFWSRKSSIAGLQWFSAFGKSFVWFLWWICLSKLANIKQSFFIKSVPTSAHRSLIIARLQLIAGVLELQHQGRLLPPALVDCPTQLTFLGFGILVTNPKVEIWKTHQIWLQRNRKIFGRKKNKKTQLDGTSTFCQSKKANKKSLF